MYIVNKITICIEIILFMAVWSLFIMILFIFVIFWVVVWFYLVLYRTGAGVFLFARTKRNQKCARGEPNGSPLESTPFTRGLLRVVQTTQIVTILCCHDQGYGTEIVKGTACIAVIGNCAGVKPVGANCVRPRSVFGIAYAGERSSPLRGADFTPAPLPIQKKQPSFCTTSVPIP